ncbi:hypothetical protein [Planococcus sp. ISL-110]|uniref:hypothetical protein n=1 Tax=Planococcus sp. ISL-110 TaxID=2819167 RepID=UPI001BE4ED94|nr:hypothetical protein [Planococcus sp. ISL-110]MBT2570576.1 hypothetical protein [Planococcus sp. ISL-110]
MKIAAAIWIPILVLLQAACGTEGTQEEASGSLTDFQVTAPQAESAEGDFIYRLATDQEQYIEGEKVAVYAELEYTGKLESIEISHAASPFYFPLHEETRDYSVEYAMNEPLLTTVLVKGEPLQERYSGSGGYSAENDDAYIAFVQNIMDNQFPSGYYKVAGYADFAAINADGSSTPHEINAQIDFKVVPKN